VRLLESLVHPEDARILGPQVVREITYRVLRGEQGGSLRAAAALHSRFGQVHRALQLIHANCARELSVEELAEAAGMSPSAFHQNFKAVTSTSPVQYVKTIRLHKARLLMVHEGLRARRPAASDIRERVAIQPRVQADVRRESGGRRRGAPSDAGDAAGRDDGDEVTANRAAPAYGALRARRNFAGGASCSRLNARLNDDSEP
jgi:AraC-like DNA-binding protein